MVGRILAPNACTFGYMMLTWFLSFCYGFVLLSAGKTPETEVLVPGNAWTYRLQSTVLLNDRFGLPDKNVGFFIEADVYVESLWAKEYKRILKIELRSPKLHIRSRKTPDDNEGFMYHDSKLDSLKNGPFFILWDKGIVNKTFLPEGESISIWNLKKGIASLFQFHPLDHTANETDSSGFCEVNYSSTSPTGFHKSKTKCISLDLPYVQNPDPLLSTKVKSVRFSDYEMDVDGKFIKSVIAKEAHEMYLTMSETVGSQVKVEQKLELVEQSKISTIKADSQEEALKNIMAKEHINFGTESLEIKQKVTMEKEENVFGKAVEEFKDNLDPDGLGTINSAKTFLHLVKIAKRSTKEDIAKVLGSKSYKKHLHQLYDVLGFAQTIDAHKAVMKKLHIEKINLVDLSERYLWACSMSSQPHPDIIKDLLSRYRKLIDIPIKVKETLILTLASMAYRLRKLPYCPAKSKVIIAVEEMLEVGLDSSKDEERYIFLRAYKNLKSPSSVPLLINIIKKGTNKEGVLAWKALRSFDESLWDEKILAVAKSTFYQLDRKHDSSSRTLAADILLEANPIVPVLEEMIYYLLSNDTTFEIKQYVLQRLKMLSERDQQFSNKISSITRRDPRINNYHILGQKGLSTALARSFFEGISSNGSLVSIQEISGGIVKRGIVNVVLEKEGSTQEIFSLGIFSGGLSSFLSSDSEGDNEDPTAGMELTVLGTQIRPFTFFTGQGELMGHVWSGTASERTTAFQASMMLQDHLEYLRLGSGFVVELDVKGASSFDLAGKVEISIWNRNAESLVEKSAGIVVNGLLSIDTDFVTSKTEFQVSVEPKLLLYTNIDFYSNVNLCMRLTQPDSLLRHNVYKIERIPGSKHKLRAAKYQKIIMPGKTYALNKKNSDMCGAIFKPNNY